VASSLAEAATTPQLVIQPCSAACAQIDALPASVVPSLRKLQVLRLHGCSSLRSVPCLDTLPHLTRLEVVGCNQLLCLRLCPSLRALRVVACASLTSIQVPPHSSSIGSHCLREAVVQGCPQLAGLVGLHLLPGLTHVEVQACNKLQQLSLGTSLQRILAKDCALLSEIRCFSGGAAAAAAATAADAVPVISLQEQLPQLQEQQQLLTTPVAPAAAVVAAAAAAAAETAAAAAAAAAPPATLSQLRQIVQQQQHHDHHKLQTVQEQWQQTPFATMDLSMLKVDNCPGVKKFEWQHHCGAVHRHLLVDDE
jgi:hypothetical protein